MARLYSCSKKGVVDIFVSVIIEDTFLDHKLLTLS